MTVLRCPAQQRPDSAITAPRAAPAEPVVVQGTPGGDTLATVRADAPLRVLERRGEWTRVRVEGWTRAPVRGAATTGSGSRSPADLRADPEGSVGQPVRWNARFISLQSAESIRTDLRPGESYILARDPEGEAGFVYIAVPPELLAKVRRLLPLQRFSFVARVRFAQSPLMGHPVLDLVSLAPQPSR